MKGPSRKEEPQQKSGLRHDYSKDKLNKCNNKPSSPVPFPTTYDEAKASCKARKRKERQESISSLYQERKVIRSNSEERPTQKKYFESKNAIRRVSSSEDFQKPDRNSTSPNRQASTDIILIYEDYEHERRRSHERFSKPLAPKSKKSSHKKSKLKARCLPKPKFKPDSVHNSKDTNAENLGDSESSLDSEVGFLQLLQVESERSPSPVRAFSPNLDLTTLHEQIDCDEPLLSSASQQIDDDTETLPGLLVASNRLLSSPRNSIIATHRIYLDKDVPQANFGIEQKPQNPIELRLLKLVKQINSIKKKIKKQESEFETKNGYKVSHADKLNDKSIRKLYIELSRMKKEHKQLVEVCPTSPTVEQIQIEIPRGLRNRHLVETLDEIEKKLEQKRDDSLRPNIIEEMSSDELLDEKVAVQRALLYLESIHGRPDSKEDRNLVRPIYDRYRNLKRMISKVQATLSGNELATIHEDETMNFITSFPPAVSELDSERSSVMTSTDSSDTDTSISENLHSLSKVELLEQHKLVSEEKKELRRSIKCFEAEVQNKSGKMIQKDDKLPMEHVYLAYKKAKAKLKLLDALVGKQL